MIVDNKVFFEGSVSISGEKVEANYRIDGKIIFLRIKSVANEKRNSKLILMQISRKEDKCCRKEVLAYGTRNNKIC